MHLGLIYDGHFKDEKKTKAPITHFLFRLIEYGDNSYNKNPEERKSVIGYCYFINGAVLSWCSKKQRIVSISITKAKYIAFKYAAQEARWLRRFINEL